MEPQFDSASPVWSGTWEKYVNAAKDYAKLGQDLSMSGWKQNGAERSWWGMPFMAANLTSGRDYCHGTTNERTVPLEDIVGSSEAADFYRDNPMALGKFETWATTFYNEYASYAIGQAWDESTGTPQFSTAADGTKIPKGFPFLEGSVFIKLLFSSIQPSDASFLDGAVQWYVNRHVALDNCERKPQLSTLTQIDIAIKDLRSPSGWVLSTLVYDNEVQSDNIWDRLVPLGVQWAGDDNSFPNVDIEDSKALTQSIKNPDVKIYEHLGCRGRLNGPIDNQINSCLGCHMNAYSNVLGGNPPPLFELDNMCEKADQANNSRYAVWEDISFEIC